MTNKPDRTELERLLSSYIDGACSDAERQVVEAALATDPQLRALHRQLTRTLECVRGVGAEAAPSHLRDRILSQMERHALLDSGQPKASRSRVLGPLTALATAAMIVAAVGAIWWFYMNPQAAEHRGTLLADRGTDQPASRAKTSEPVPQDTPAVSLQGQEFARPATSAPVAEPPVTNGNLADHDTAAPDVTTYREAAAKALVARQVAAQEVAAAQAASDKAAARVAAAQAAAQHLATIRAAASQSNIEDALAAAPVVPPSAPAPDALSESAMADMSEAVPQEPTTIAETTIPAAPLVSGSPSAFHLPAGTASVGAMEIRVVADEADHQALSSAAETIVRQLGGAPIQLALGPAGSTLVATVPAAKKYLLANEMGNVSGARDVKLHELAADRMSLEIASMLSQPQVWWYPDGLTSKLAFSPSVPIRIVIQSINEDPDRPNDP
jgi:hypothetical protein